MKIRADWQEVRIGIVVAAVFAVMFAGMAIGDHHQGRFGTGMEGFVLIAGLLLFLFLWPLFRDLFKAFRQVMAIRPASLFSAPALPPSASLPHTTRSALVSSPPARPRRRAALARPCATHGAKRAPR